MGRARVDRVPGDDVACRAALGPAHVGLTGSVDLQVGAIRLAADQLGGSGVAGESEGDECERADTREHRGSFRRRRSARPESCSRPKSAGGHASVCFLANVRVRRRARQGINGSADRTESRPCRTNVQSHRGTGSGRAAPSRTGGARSRGRARTGAGALPRHGDRPGAPRRADHRRRLDVDGNDAVQPQPARARRPRRRRGDRCGRRPARLQHDRRLRQPVAGDTRDARLADLARGDRRLDRADGARARLRRPRLPGRLRQDGAGRLDGARPRRQAGGRPLRRADARGPLARP